MLKALDLFCGVGLVADGLMQCGFDVTGIDIDGAVSQWYPADFIQADAVDPPIDLRHFDFIWASPPCQAYSENTPKERKVGHPDLIDAVRRRIAEHPYTVIENVRNAPIRADLRLTGLAVGLPRLIRLRKFELSWLLSICIQQPPLPRPDPRLWYDGTYRHITKQNRISFRPRMVRLGRIGPDVPSRLPAEERRQIMGVTRYVPDQKLGEGIPPAMAHWIGCRAVECIERYKLAGAS